jgi:hypothetical protein
MHQHRLVRRPRVAEQIGQKLSQAGAVAVMLALYLAERIAYASRNGWRCWGAFKLDRGVRAADGVNLASVFHALDLLRSDIGGELNHVHRHAARDS